MPRLEDNRHGPGTAQALAVSSGLGRCRPVCRQIHMCHMYDDVVLLLPEILMDSIAIKMLRTPPLPHGMGDCDLGIIWHVRCHPPGPWVPVEPRSE
jgi:hypothetical protein